MSLVTTATLSWVPSSRHSSAISELLPVPTGPATPSRRARAGGDGRRPSGWSSWWCWWSGTEQAPLTRTVSLTPLLDERGAVRRDLVRTGDGPDTVDHRLHLVGRAGHPADAGAGIERFQLERGADHRLHVVVADQPRGLLGVQPGGRGGHPEHHRSAPGPAGGEVAQVPDRGRRPQQAAAEQVRG